MKRKMLALLLVMLLLAGFCAPAMADVNLTSNGKALDQSVNIIDGRGMVSLSTITRISGADASADADENIKIIKNDTILKMKVGDSAADLNGKVVTAPVAPQFINGILMVPLGFVCNALQIDINWDPQTQSINILYSEKREGMTPEDILGKCFTATKTMNSYKITGNAQVTTNMSIVTPQGTNTVPAITVNETIQGAFSQKPLVMDMNMKVDMPAGLPGAQAQGAQNMEMVMNDQGVFMKMPDGVWVKMDMPGIDYKALLEQQSNLQDPQYIIDQMKKYGITLVFNNEQNKDGKSYWVISAAMDSDAFRQIYQTMLSKMPSLLPQGSATSDQLVPQMMNDMAKNMQADVVMNMFIDKSNYLIKSVNGDMNINLALQVPASAANQSPGQMNMKMLEKINFEISDYGVVFTSPNVSKAISFSDYVKTLAASTKTAKS
ncbi:MAG TPA: copper amine oxidase N-terminal domain-containing protein [Syntrophomonadaceae bacterium]|nr:copper amine oxidase N-terminal domain-containing protein [Syntrophomonadaceae bacterium]